jgi:spermidine synthase
LVALLLFLSGALAIVYEVAWQRQCAQLFGSAAPATAAVLAAYFAGLGVGSIIVGKWAHHFQRPLRAYGILELGVAAGALCVRPLLQGFEEFYRGILSSFHDAPGLLLAARTAFAALALFVPTFLMGGTLPVLGHWVDQQRGQLGQTAGWLYVSNTAGACVGAIAVPFALLPYCGVSGSIAMAAAGNFAIGIVALVWDRTDRPKPRVQSSGARQTEPGQRRVPERAQAEVTTACRALPVASLSLLSGAATFGFQVLWNRALAQVHEDSLYAFALVVAVVIASLAAGAQLARWQTRRGRSIRNIVATAWICGGGTAFAGPFVVIATTSGLETYVANQSWAVQLLHLLGIVGLIVLLPMTCLGMALPALMQAAGEQEQRPAGHSLGRLLSANIVGAICGSLGAGFLLSPSLGLWPSIGAISGALMGCGVALKSTRLEGAALAARIHCMLAGLVGFAGGALLLEWADLPSTSISSANGERLVSVREGVHGIVTVVEQPGSRRLKLNNHYALGGSASAADERVQAHLPLLFHPAPREVAHLGLGTGISAGAALAHSVERLTLIELVPEVVEAARVHFAEFNDGVVSAARTRLVVDDASHFIRSSGEKFDVIIGDLVVPWRQGEATLFTRDHFVATRAALNIGGMYCQWLPLFQLSSEEFHVLVRTFLSVFPNALVIRADFLPTQPALGLIGTADGRVPELVSITERVKSMKADPLNRHLAHPAATWMYVVGVLWSTDLPPGEGRLNTLDDPWIELAGPRLHAGHRRDVLMVGRKLQSWLRRVSLRTEERIKPDHDQRRAMAAGLAFAEMLLLVEENDLAAATRLEAEVRHLLPSEVAHELFGSGP